MHCVKFILFFAIAMPIFAESNRVIIYINWHVICNIDIEDIKPPNFHCQKETVQTEAGIIKRFNSTHTWYEDGNKTCIAPLKTVKEVGGRNCYGIHTTAIATPYHTNERFNSTHAWFIQDNLRCIASIGTIKKIAGRNCHRVFPTVVRTPSKCGSDENGNPLKCGDVFN